jgi:hypothetical protein
VKRQYLSTWPKVNAYVEPSIREKLEQEAAYRALSVSAIVRETLAAKYSKPANKAGN